MTTRQEVLRGVTVLMPHGRVDSANANQFEEDVAGAIRAGAAKLVIDCAEIDYMSSAGLRVVLVAAKMAKSAGGKLALCAMKPPVRQIFDVSGFSKIVAIAADREEAIAAV